MHKNHNKLEGTPAAKRGERQMLATKYHNWGWKPIPLGVGSKKASSAWKRWQNQRPSRGWIDKQWPEHSNRNIGILLGSASGNLIVRDFDVAEEYLQWRINYPDLAAMLPTVRTRRGFHVYLTDCDGITISKNLRSFGVEGELKGDGTYVVSAGSLVRDDSAGSTSQPFEYTWEIPIETKNGKPVIPMICLDNSGLIPFEKATLHTERKAKWDPAVPNKPTTPSSIQQHPGSTKQNIGIRAKERINEIIERHCISGPGQRNNALKDMAMELVCTYSGKPPEEIAGLIFDEWWRDNNQHCQTSEEESWLEFDSMLDRFLGQHFLVQVAAAFPETPLPHWAEGWTRSDTLQAVARLMIAADQVKDGEPFFISVRNAAKIIGNSSRTTVHRSIQALERKGYINVVERGDDKPGGKATVYKLLIDAHGKSRSHGCSTILQ